MGRHRVLEADLAGRMAAAVGFRNVLVHEYVSVDDMIVVARLDDLSDLRAYIAAIATWLELERRPR
ncbi:DUF86 domain-containing protein [Actinomycetospora endophytica]|uniref:DUF86 domain-containing protein n=1 Tax=Actinomycetospora endophytica TaxID=2291215 RepID=A0ABS8PFE6_9PSEU|nr:DUF86 domain-containing protein [Actinomycetospora endophytica]